MIDYRTDKEKLGHLGELLVSKLLGGTLSEDKFDSNKDLTLSDGTPVEVKTQNRHPTKNLLTIRAEKEINFRKCLTVQRLIFVEFDKTNFISIRECTDRMGYEKYKTLQDVTMIGWPISKMKTLHRIEDEQLSKQMRELSSSTLFKNLS